MPGIGRIAGAHGQVKNWTLKGRRTKPKADQAGAEPETRQNLISQPKVMFHLAARGSCAGQGGYEHGIAWELATRHKLFLVVTYQRRAEGEPSWTQFTYRNKHAVYL